MTDDKENSPLESCGARDRLEAAVLSGDRAGAEGILRTVGRGIAIEWKNSLLSRLTADCLNGRGPFCQLTAAAPAACAGFDEQAPPVACCGGIAGNTSTTGRDFMMMLLRAWGVPSMDLGTDVPEHAFLNAVADHGVRFVICTAFSRADLKRIRVLDKRARELGIRDRFSLLVSGAQLEHGGDDAVSDCPDHRAAAVAEWVVQRWMA